MPAPSMAVAPWAHVCAVAWGQDSRARLAAAWVRDGLAAGQQVTWVEPSQGDLLRWLRRDGLDSRQPLRSGQLRLVSPEDVLALRSAAEIPVRLGRTIALLERAAAQGYRGVRVGVEARVARAVMPSSAVQLQFDAAWEDATRERRIAMLCLYDEAEDRVPLARAIRLHRRGVTDGVVLAAVAPHGVRLVGEIDLANVETVVEVLAGAAEDGILTVDMARVSFIDVRGVARLVEFARALAPRNRLRLLSPPPLLHRVVDLAGWRGEFDIEDAPTAV